MTGQEKKEPVLYDTDAGQRVPLRLTVGGENYEVAFQFKPITDDFICEWLDADGDEGTQPPLFAALIESAEGAADDDGQAFTAEALAELVPEADQQLVVDSALLGTRIIPAPPAARKLNFRRRAETNRLRMAAYFNGEEVMTEHEMLPPDNNHVRVWNALQRGAFPIKFGAETLSSRARTLVALYNALGCKATGYAGRVPAQHKMVVVTAHMNGQRELVLGK